MNKAVTYHLHFFCLVFLIALFSCSSDRVFEAYQGMEALSWSVKDTATFEVGPMDQKNLVAMVGIRFNDDFDFHNIYVRCFLRDSMNNVIKEQLIPIQLFDPRTGKPLGSGFGNVYTRYDTLPEEFAKLENIVKFQMVQYMRKEELAGIESVGLKIIQKK